MAYQKKIQKVLLIFPPTKLLRGGFKLCLPPLGIAYLAAVIKNDYQVKILDATVEGFYRELVISREFIRYGLFLQDIGKEIEKFSPDVLGISCLYSSQYPMVIEICKLTKEIDKKIITMAGGTHPTFLAKECLCNQDLDFIILGEWQYTFRELLQRIKNGRDFTGIDGLAFRENGNIRVNPKTKYIEQLDGLPFPARELLPMDKYQQVNMPHGSIAKSKMNTTLITSRGCRARCIFCSSARFWGNRYRTRSAQNVLDELEHLVRDYGIKEIHFEDDNLTLNRERARQIFQGLIDRRINILWNAPNGIALWTLDDDLLELMKRSGCYEFTMGIESGDQQVLSKIIKKPLNLKKVEPLVKTMKRLKIRTRSFFILGFPGETKAQMRNTFNLAKKLRLQLADFFIACPLPGTELYEICKEKGYLKKGFNFTELEFLNSTINTPEFSAEEVARLASREYLLYNLGLMLRNPVGFFIRYGKIIFTKPVFSIGMVVHKYLRKAIS